METVEYKGYKIKVELDMYPTDPIEEWDGNCLYALSHSRYSLQNDTDLSTSDYGSWEEFKEDLIKKYRPLAILPVYMYDHSGQTINTTGFSCKWDSGQIGFSFINKKCLNKWGYKSRKGYEKATGRTLEDDIVSNVKLYDNYISGEVFAFTVKDEDGEDVDSCSGFYGYDHEKSGLLDDAKSSINGEIEQRLKTSTK